MKDVYQKVGKTTRDLKVEQSGVRQTYRISAPGGNCCEEASLLAAESESDANLSGLQQTTAARCRGVGSLKQCIPRMIGLKP